MAKGGAVGKLGKLKGMIRRWQSASVNNNRPCESQNLNVCQSLIQHHGGAEDERIPGDLHLVYVGKSRRRYFVSSHLIGHPLFQVLVQRSGAPDGGPGKPTTLLGCEVVLFEHLLWMLENADPQPESLDELVEFYCC
ncbi:auxin-responsive protein SAUR76-like [Wolffia australiana]